jgi:hypothetical protein
MKFPVAQLRRIFETEQGINQQSLVVSATRPKQNPSKNRWISSAAGTTEEKSGQYLGKVSNTRVTPVLLPSKTSTKENHIMKLKLFIGALLITCGICIPTQTFGVIVDNSDPGFSASPAWATGTGGYGGTFRYRSVGPFSDPATWKTPAMKAGTYSVSAAWVSGANRSAAASYVVYHSSGATTVVVNQQLNGGLWNLLGNWSMNAGTNQVKLSSWGTTGYIVIADVIKWQ